MPPNMTGREKSLEIQPELIQNIHWGFYKTQVLASAVEVDVFTSIHAGNATVEKIARGTGLPLRSARMLLDALVGMGLLGKTRGLYKLEPEAKAFLVRGESNFLGAALQFDDFSRQGWTSLTEALRLGRPVGTAQAAGDRKAFFQELVKRIFPVSYASGVALCKKLGVGKTLRGQRVLDVGCGSAAWSIAFALADPTTKVVGIDYPEVIEVAQGYVQRFRLQKNYEFREGDFHQLPFEAEGYDLVILGHICHMEGEAATRKLLKKSFDALKPGGKLLVAEFIANDLRTGPELPLLFALNMLLHTEHGDVFTAKELKRWLNFVGFKKVAALAVQYPASVMVATK
ncbi:methyltransferase domain-containing protein [Deltaproteobacteria bacterium PRO3]|nr:methyltransferase domain-containing protein [Deltaproteobacteria bacterium PRO3]